MVGFYVIKLQTNRRPVDGGHRRPWPWAKGFTSLLNKPKPKRKGTLREGACTLEVGAADVIRIPGINGVVMGSFSGKCHVHHFEKLLRAGELVNGEPLYKFFFLL